MSRGQAGGMKPYRNTVLSAVMAALYVLPILANMAGLKVDGDGLSRCALRPSEYLFRECRFNESTQNQRRDIMRDSMRISVNNAFSYEQLSFENTYRILGLYYLRSRLAQYKKFDANGIDYKTVFRQELSCFVALYPVLDTLIREVNPAMRVDRCSLKHLCDSGKLYRVKHNKGALDCVHATQQLDGSFNAIEHDEKGGHAPGGYGR